MTLPAKDKRFDPGFPIADKDGRPTALFRDYLVLLDRLVTLMVAGNAPSNLVNAANDAAAAAAGVPVGNLYRNGSLIQVRVV
ncbi:hypothetical protein [Bradyrhizobium betae]|uniref:Uncharacterized protein n=1 Tax=Bradyrhizobium betae TaxID=244734 RepID=A0A5P6NZ68_9BRAD|nr:hypothetical protein [Bradyrhizobium betae]MCS3725506.1 hypothetical protein [Bradyrhizobium betae]QFI71206.1 hypothetical protein F8237_01750 [Bradyrhizobium betae]